MSTLEKYHLTLKEKSNLCSGGSSWATYGIEEKGIPAITMTDGTYGVRYCKPGEECIDGVEAMDVVDLNLSSGSEQLEKYYRATCFPSPSAMACSWDKKLIREAARYIGCECGALDVDMLLAPAINIRRDPRGGRGFEYFSEDPVLTARMAEAFIKGLDEVGVSACLKHFACNNSEYQRTQMDSVVDERALQEIYLYAFREIVKHQPPAAIMSSYNKLNGEQAAECKKLLNDILRDDWGYKGMVVSDWGGIKNRIASIRAGGDLEMPQNRIFNKLLETAVEDEQLSEEELDVCVNRILEFVEQANANRVKHPKTVNGCEGYRLAVKTASESSVLLKNEDHILPIDVAKLKHLLVVGDIAVSPRYQGGGCAVINPTTISIPYDEIVRMCGHEVDVKFAQGYTNADESSAELLEEIGREAAQADYVIVFAGVKIRDDSEGFNREHLNIEPSHVQAIRAAAEKNENVVVVLYNGDAVTVDDFEPYAKGILECFFNGQGGGVAVAQLLFGQSNPCGKLTTTFPEREEDLPGYLTFPGEHGKHVYTEGIYVGYRYYDKRRIQPRYEFGYGLSYTEFQYSDFMVQVSEDSSRLTASVRVKNVGEREGKEIVQFYLEPDQVEYMAPVRMLKGFDKVALKPGESKVVSVTFKSDELFEYYDPEVGRFVVGSGTYYLSCGESSRKLHGRVGLDVRDAENFKAFQMDSLHNQVFADEDSKKIYIEYLKRIHVINGTTNIQAAITSLSNMFWGLYRALIAISIADPDVRVDESELREVVCQMNEQRRLRMQNRKELQVRIL